MRNGIFLLVLFIVVLIQATLLNYLRVFGVKPDLLILFTVVSAVYLNLRPAIAFSLLAGLFKDLFGSAGFGINIFLLPLAGYLAWKVSRQISIDDPIGISVAAFLAVLLNDTVSRPLYFYSGKYISTGIFLRTMFIEAVYTALAWQAAVYAFAHARKAFCRYRLARGAAEKQEGK